MKAASFNFADRNGGARWYASLFQRPTSSGQHEFDALFGQQHQLTGQWRVRARAEYFNSCSRLKEQNDLLRQEIARLEEAIHRLD